MCTPPESVTRLANDYVYRAKISRQKKAEVISMTEAGFAADRRGQAPEPITMCLSRPCTVTPTHVQTAKRLTRTWKTLIIIVVVQWAFNVRV